MYIQYKCSNKKKLVIRKLYSNMGTIGTHQPRSLKQRIALLVSLLSLLACLLTVGTIVANMVGTNYANNVLIPEMEARIETFTQKFEDIEYKLESEEYDNNQGMSYLTFRYHYDEDTEDSVIRYIVRNAGKIELDDIYIYIYGDERDGNRNFNNELRLLLEFSSESFAEDELNEFLLGIQDALDGKIETTWIYSKNRDCMLSLQRYDPYVYIYNRNY